MFYRPHRTTYESENERENNKRGKEEPALRHKGISRQEQNGCWIYKSTGNSSNSPLSSGGSYAQNDRGAVHKRGGNTLILNPPNTETAGRITHERTQARRKKGMNVDVGDAPRIRHDQLGPITCSRSRKQTLNNCI